MSTAIALHACATPYCHGTTTHGRYCAICVSVRVTRVQDTQRLNSYQRGYTRRWQRYRLAYLHQHPLCADPYQRHPMSVTAASVVDHKTPHRGDQRLFWDVTNHQALCAKCHNYKTRMYDMPHNRSTMSIKAEVCGVSGVFGLGHDATTAVPPRSPSVDETGRVVEIARHRRTENRVPRLNDNPSSNDEGSTHG